MSTESISDRREHIRSVSVTALSALLGVGAALASATWVGLSKAAAQDTQALAFVLGAILVQYVLINLSGIYGEDEFGAKHYLFIAFMTFSLWFVTWGILLTAEVTG
ncbi:hypothetical protein [Natrinema pallidum]|uniref:Uncharacterized protein n=2 Tax=Natrinema pallidum TaxID=69527 RepID=L9YRC9_9EURY|nr:hypothetical protein [Natrinema pallidum]ELY75997.1 hypothetical protein C487_12878 [Natrinema pallidum DSM 3751]QCW02726.1 hypothetical protein FGF80_05530 [Natrinema pallidum]